ERSLRRDWRALFGYRLRRAGHTAGRRRWFDLSRAASEDQRDRERDQRGDSVHPEECSARRERGMQRGPNCFAGPYKTVHIMKILAAILPRPALRMDPSRFLSSRALAGSIGLLAAAGTAACSVVVEPPPSASPPSSPDADEDVAVVVLADGVHLFAPD